ncbi:MAG TPA: RDD family protein [Acidimicrobiales bacterium]|nr:RDD family protein [Acidimicrobiales bacterium]
MSTTTAPARRSRRYTPPRRALSPAGSPGPRAAAVPAPDVAPVARRALAAVVDGVAVVLGVIGLAEAGWRTGLWRAMGASTAGWVDWAWSFHKVAWTMVATAVVYHGLTTARWQASPGKLLAGLRVEVAAGGRPPARLAWWRALWSATTFIPSVVTPLVVTAGWLATAGGSRRSLADRAAGTRVVRARRGKQAATP